MSSTAKNKFLLQSSSFKIDYHVFCFTANFAAENLLLLSKPFAGNIMEKAEIFGTDKARWLPSVLRKISPSQLSPWYGGDEDWKPVSVGGISAANLTIQPPST